MKNYIHQEFVINKKTPTYSPHEFKSICTAAGAPTLFQTILSAITTDRQSGSRKTLNEKRVVSVLYKLCYCLNQRCNIAQVDHALYLTSANINQEGHETEHILGNVCCRRSTDNLRQTLSVNHEQQLKQFFESAIINEWLLVLVIDDYTKIHTMRRPGSDKASNAVSMCTIIVKAFKQIKAIKLQEIENMYDPLGVNIRECVSAITSESNMYKLASTYASIMPDWLTQSFFNPELQRQRLSVHEYCESNSVRLMRKMDDLHLVNFVELQLKSQEGFATAYDIALSTGLRAYMKKFIVIQPGDWPCQFYCRQLVYKKLAASQEVFEHHKDHTYAKLPGNIINSSKIPTSDHTYVFEMNSNEQTAKSLVRSTNRPLYASIIPTIGPLHISLNSREHLLLNFHPFFKSLYEFLFPRSTFPNKPSCKVQNPHEHWTLLRGCWHSFHNVCLKGSNICPLCTELHLTTVNSLG